jgi:ABC-type lipoprotein release transport system permease subunit
MGAGNTIIKQIFFFEGLLISLSGAVLGLLLGLLVCFVQQQFGLIKLQGGGSFIISAYPVKLIATDFVYVFITIAFIGIGAAWLPVQRIGRQLKSNKIIS